MFKRDLARTIKNLFSKFPVVCVVGPRQSGKTTLVKSTFGSLDYVSLEDLDAREFAINDPRGFLATYNKGVVIDEVQRVPQLFSYIQTAVDKENRAGLFVLTGSSNILLYEKISQTLAGRVAMSELLPLSLEELKKGGFKLRDCQEYMFKGFYPRIYDKKIKPTDWYQNYIATYVERDVRLIKNITDLNTFQKFVKLCAGRIGRVLNLSSLGNDCGITHNTAKDWLSILESTYIIFLLAPFHKSFNKRLVKMPKLYFYDTGLASSLLGIASFTQLATHYLKGELFESFVLSELIKNRINSGAQPNLYYWRDKTGHEIDCIIESGNRLRPIEIKSGRTISDGFFSGLNYWRHLAKSQSEKGCLIYNGEENQKRSHVNIIGWKDIASVL